jgi:signal transduction histidine kinase
MSELGRLPVAGRLRQVRDFARSTESRKPLSVRAVVFDVMLAGLFLLGALTSVRFLSHGLIPAVVTTAPLAFRRRYPLTVLLVVVLGMVATKDWATWISFLALVFAAYSAVVNSKFRGAALLTMAPVAVVIGAVFWHATSALPSAAHAFGHLSVIPRGPGVPGRPGYPLDANFPWRLAVLLSLVSLVSIAVVGTAVYAGDRIRQMQSEHEAAAQRMLATERSRIASELHDVVTHNVSVMIVQAGAARQVLADAPDQATRALLAVESSGRAAMTELRNLLGLLSPSTGAGDAPGGQGSELRPQPGLAQLRGLTDRVTATGLPIELHAEPVPDDLPPGVDLAAFRVVQEALTNVIKHAGKPPTTVSVGYQGGCVVVEVTDEGAPIPVAVPAAPGCGRGLLGLRERVSLYGGELAAGPMAGGGWQVRARIPGETFAPAGFAASASDPATASGHADPAARASDPAAAASPTPDQSRSREEAGPGGSVPLAGQPR